jgi:hypothetical protein
MFNFGSYYNDFENMLKYYLIASNADTMFELGHDYLMAMVTR